MINFEFLVLSFEFPSHWIYHGEGQFEAEQLIIRHRIDLSLRWLRCN